MTAGKWAETAVTDPPMVTVGIDLAGYSGTTGVRSLSNLMRHVRLLVLPEIPPSEVR
jgi:hypothetical protein